MSLRRRFSCLVGILPIVISLQPGPATAAGLTGQLPGLEERVAGRRAVEEVLWRHRIWPADNPEPRPPLDAVLTEEAIRAGVVDSLRKSEALERLWNRPITPAQLQAEIERMIRGSRQPELLREIFAALGDDPLMIAECVARPALADRLIRDWYATDRRFHGALEQEALRAVAAIADASELKTLGGVYSETVWENAPAGAPERQERPATVRLSRDEWRDVTGRIERATGPDVRPGQLGPLREDGTGFSVTSVLERGESFVRTATVRWEKTTFEDWWAAERTRYAGDPAVATGEYTLPPATPTATCTDDTWMPTRVNAPSPRVHATSVWTGTELIVWGGTGDPVAGPVLRTGGRYTPATDTWAPVGTGLNLPAARAYHTAVWTGSRMIVWGGGDGTNVLNTGGRYDPLTDAWSTTKTGLTAPSARESHTAVWTGSVMIVWGGTTIPASGTTTGAGGRYDPVTDTWSGTSLSAGVPTARTDHSAVWTGSRMIVWGGTSNTLSGPLVSTGGSYDPFSDHWTSVGNGAGVPSARSGHTAVWTGSVMIVWGGRGSLGGSALDTGARYFPSTDTWLPTGGGAGLPSARFDHTAVWTGPAIGEMLVWGGDDGAGPLASGARYSPATDSWTGIAGGGGAPSARVGHTAVWTDSEMIVWGGLAAPGPAATSTGGRYDPVADSWVPTLDESEGASGRRDSSVVWTGTEMIVWGGSGTGAVPTSTGARYIPATDDWQATSTGAGSPSARAFHTAVWTGTRMIIWGGLNGVSLGDGSRYDPLTNTWSATSTTGNVPAARRGHTAVWTGTLMVVWGGRTTAIVNTGGRYDPAGDAWVGTSTAGAVPAPRVQHTAVWTGSRMIVWGGSNTGGDLADGGRYDPATNTWAATSTGANAPGPRSLHTAVWTGSRMIVWGGVNNFVDLNTGGRYDPVADTWSTTSTGAGVPAARSTHSAVWTGSAMIVWGGEVNLFAVNSGARYDPATNAWLPTAAGPGVTAPRDGHLAVWTGSPQSEMIVWGGGLYLETGGRYCFDPQCATPSVYYRDADADGFGVSGDTRLACSQPAGFAAVAGDCNDANPSIRPGILDATCDGVDDNCSGSPDEDFVSQPTTCGLGICLSSGVTICSGGSQFDTCFPGEPQPETCDGLDDNCDGIPDNPPVPVEAQPLLVAEPVAGTARLSWPAVFNTTGYDVVRGGAAALRATGGDYSVAVTVCLANDQTGTLLDDGMMPAAGESFWYLIRAINCGGSGTWDSAGGSQVAPRDAGIAASPFSCP